MRKRIEFKNVGSALVEVLFCLLATSVLAFVFSNHQKLFNVLEAGEIQFFNKKQEYAFSGSDSCSDRSFKAGFKEKYCCNEKGKQCAVYIISSN